MARYHCRGPHLFSSQTQSAVSLTLFGCWFVFWPLCFRVTGRCGPLALWRRNMEGQVYSQLITTMRWYSARFFFYLINFTSMPKGFKNSCCLVQMILSFINRKCANYPSLNKGYSLSFSPCHKDEAVCFALAFLATSPLLAIPGCDWQFWHAGWGSGPTAGHNPAGYRAEFVN